MIGRGEARMIAEELFKLFKAEGGAESLLGDEMLTTDGVAKLLKRSTSWVYHNGDKFPRILGDNGQYRYSRNGVLQVINNMA